MDKTIFKDEISQAVDILMDRFRKNCGIESADFEWIDGEGGILDINSGLLIISFADLIYAVRNGINYKDLLEWQDYNSRLIALDCGSRCIALDAWHTGKAERISSFLLDRVEEAMAAYKAAKNTLKTLQAELMENKDKN